VALGIGKSVQRVEMGMQIYKTWCHPQARCVDDSTGTDCVHLAPQRCDAPGPDADIKTLSRGAGAIEDRTPNNDHVVRSGLAGARQQTE
jgi:hypothetical protein